MKLPIFKMNAYAHILAQFYTEQQTHAYTQKKTDHNQPTQTKRTRNRTEQNTKKREKEKMSKEYLQ